MYRPEGWKNPHEEDTKEHRERRCMRPEICGCDLHDAYEQGADTMLEGLRNSRQAYRPNSIGLRRKIDRPLKGYWVFIPDDKPTDEYLMAVVDYLDAAEVPLKGRKIMDENGIVYDIPNKE
jgi:hypothetical protein